MKFLKAILVTFSTILSLTMQGSQGGNTYNWNLAESACNATNASNCNSGNNLSSGVTCCTQTSNNVINCTATSVITGPLVVAVSAGSIKCWDHNPSQNQTAALMNCMSVSSNKSSDCTSLSTSDVSCCLFNNLYKNGTSDRAFLIS